MSTYITLALVVAGIIGLIFAYGKGKEKIGSLTARNEGIDGQEEREADAKEIESRPAPNTADGVADAWDRMRSDGTGKEG